MAETFYIIDFDSTLIRSEALDELADIALNAHPEKDGVLEEIKKTTELGMDGSITITESLKRRIKLLRANRKHVAELTLRLKQKVSKSFLRQQRFLKQNADKIYVVTSGFCDYVLPIAAQLGLSQKNVLCNSFVYDSQGNIRGFDRANFLAQSQGKVKALKSLELKGRVFVIGDGYTDYEMKKAGDNVTFVAFTENVARPSVVKVADLVVKSFDEFLYTQKLPMKHSYPKSKLKVLLLESVHSLAIDSFKKEGFSVETIADALDEKELLKLLPEISLLGLRSKTRVSRKALETANRLLAVGAYCIGTDQVDLSAASDAGVAVFNAPYSNTRSVVEIVLAEIIVLLRKAFELSTQLHRGVWLKSAAGCHEVRGKKLGIVGYGNIGSQLSVLAEGLGMEVFYYDIVEKLSLGKARKCRSLSDLLRRVDIVTLHVDGRRENENLIGDKEFRQMQPGTLFINFSRGKIVDIAALVKHLQNGHIAGAGIDVFPYEPKGKNEKFISELRKFENVILTPHIGGSTSEAQRNIAEFVTARLLDYVNNGSSFGSVNLPQIQVPRLQRAHRLLHVHSNVPGILAQINGILARNKINILGQYLKTNERTGYVITDVNKKYNRGVIEELKDIPHTIKFRVLY